MSVPSNNRDNDTTSFIPVSSEVSSGKGPDDVLNRSIATDLIHSEEQVHHALPHLLRLGLEGHETMTMYRNVRKKYDTEGILGKDKKEGVRQFHSFRSVEEGVLAAYQTALCPADERGASGLYVNINPRHVPNALKATHELYYKWVENKAGASKQQVRKGNMEDFAGTLDHVFTTRVSREKSRSVFGFIDVDDTNRDTWLKAIRSAIGDEAIEMVIETRGGYHVVYRPSAMSKQAHLALSKVLESDTSKGKDASVTKLDGTALSCALAGGYQGHHATVILQCSCQKNPALLAPL